VLEPDGAGSAEFAVYFGIAALQTFFAQVDAVFGAHETGFPVRVVGARPHLNSLETKNGFLFRFLTGKETHRKKRTIDTLRSPRLCGKQKNCRFSPAYLATLGPPK
jgi:hypothetical protein